MLASLTVLLCASAATAAVPYQQYILAPPSRTIRPVSVFRQHGSLSSQTALLSKKTPSNGALVLDAFNSSVTYDFGKNVAGWVNLDVSSRTGSVGVTFSESSLWVSSEACDATADAALDSPLVFNVTHSGHYAAPTNQERGAFRYLTIVNLGSTKVSVKDLWVHFTAMPHWDDDALQDYTGWFHSNDEKLNRYALRYVRLWNHS